MPRDIGEYQIQITQFVDELCYVYYKHSQPEDRRDINSEIALIAHQNLEQMDGRIGNNLSRMAPWDCKKCDPELVASPRHCGATCARQPR